MKCPSVWTTTTLLCGHYLAGQSLDYALCWAYEEVTVDGAMQKLIPDAEVVEFLQVQ
jgi:hypothetical protein